MWPTRSLTVTSSAPHSAGDQRGALPTREALAVGPCWHCWLLGWYSPPMPGPLRVRLGPWALPLAYPLRQTICVHATSRAGRGIQRRDSDGLRRRWQTGGGDVWPMVLGNLFWVLAYDTEYAMVDRDDDLRIGIQTSAITLGRWDVPGHHGVLRGLPGDMDLGCAGSAPRAGRVVGAGLALQRHRWCGGTIV